MKIITFEGMDKSGKHTASQHLYEYLKDKGYSVVASEFHRYDTPTGSLIKDYLYGKYVCSNETIQLIMSADKQAQQDWFKELESKGVEYLILDRYYLSQKVYSDYFLEVSELSLESKNQYSKIYSDIISMFRPSDFTYYLHNSSEVSMARKGQHGENDRYESDKFLLDFVGEHYLSEVKKEKEYAIISAEQPLEDVLNDVIKKIPTWVK